MLTAKDAKEISIRNKTLEVLLTKIESKIYNASELGYEFTQFASEGLDSMNVKALVCVKLKQLGYQVYTGNQNRIDIYWENVG